eukprot:359936-Chlamydomonas_euryale.AAC.5
MFVRAHAQSVSESRQSACSVCIRVTSERMLSLHPSHIRARVRATESGSKPKLPAWLMLSQVHVAVPQCHAPSPPHLLSEQAPHMAHPPPQRQGGYTRHGPSTGSCAGKGSEERRCVFYVCVGTGRIHQGAPATRNAVCTSSIDMLGVGCTAVCSLEALAPLDSGLAGRLQDGWLATRWTAGEACPFAPNLVLDS